MDSKHKSKLHKGFTKQVLRQDDKPEFTKVKIVPHILSYSPKHGKYKPLKAIHRNNKWNGMNLKVIHNSFTVHRVGGMYGKFRINEEGKYTLSGHGKQLLRKKRERKLIQSSERL